MRRQIKYSASMSCWSRARWVGKGGEMDLRSGREKGLMSLVGGEEVNDVLHVRPNCRFRFRLH